VLVHLLVPGLAAALHATTARRCVTLNLSAEQGETRGLSPARHLEVLAAHAPGLKIDAVLADPSGLGDREALAEAAATLGATLVVRPVQRRDGTARHDPLLLAAAYRDAFEDSADGRR
jgi:2-phospho-L-lactate transferase/gluconeogenesis factor (CofD/UPF0052 family)